MRQVIQKDVCEEDEAEMSEEEILSMLSIENRYSIASRGYRCVPKQDGSNVGRSRLLILRVPSFLNFDDIRLFLDVYEKLGYNVLWDENVFLIPHPREYMTKESKRLFEEIMQSGESYVVVSFRNDLSDVHAVYRKQAVVVSLNPISSDKFLKNDRWSDLKHWLHGVWLNSEMVSVKEVLEQMKMMEGDV